MTLLPEYRAQLYAAAGRRAHRRFRTITSGWPVAASAALAAGVLVAAVAVLSHRQPPRSSAPSGPAASARALVDMLGVLRRPQSEADRRTWVPGFFRTFASPGCGKANTRYQCTLRLDRPLIRQVTVPGSGYRIGLLPYTSAGKIAGVAVTLRGPGINYLAGGPWSDATTIPAGFSALRTRGLMLSGYVSAGVNRGAIVVPDGVARVVIGPIRLLDRSVMTQVTPKAGVTATVHDNVALFQLHGLTVQGLKLRFGALGRFFLEGSGSNCRATLSVYKLRAEAYMLWLAPDGRVADHATRVVNHTVIRFPVYVGTTHPAPGTPPLCPPTG
jgi:hypothetical protein